MSLKNEYRAAIKRTTDINEHLPNLMMLASECRHVTEFGVRTGESSRALLYGVSRNNLPSATVRSYDVIPNWEVAALFSQARREGVDAQYIIENSLLANIEPTEFLLIDSDHRYEQLFGELSLNSHKVHKYIAMHDTYNMGLGAADTEPRGLLTAIIDFMISQNNTWVFHSHYTNNNGLTVLRRNTV
jgi:hypothetical protein